jgi:hypothetical protein
MGKVVAQAGNPLYRGSAIRRLPHISYVSSCRKITPAFPNHLASGSPGSSGSGKFDKK